MESLYTFLNLYLSYDFAKVKISFIKVKSKQLNLFTLFAVLNCSLNCRFLNFGQANFSHFS